MTAGWDTYLAPWIDDLVVNLLAYSGYYDIALRDFGLMLAALTLTRLAWSSIRRDRGAAEAPRRPARAAMLH
jgi:hypothetical protein